MVYSEILLAPGSGEKISFTLRDANKQAIDFTIGYWAARLSIVRYPGCLEGAFHISGTDNQTGTDSHWLTLENSQVVMIPDPAVTQEWNFSRYHYDCYLIGPNVTAPPVRIAHGPFMMDL
ncbi:MAG TPA: hypothetical protein VLN58_02155 [Verrucomicrobiae bacterium]|nr:hypothetical protein [Verrucomicrobiae bacterium]